MAQLSGSPRVVQRRTAGRPTKADARDVRSEILDAAERLFSIYGYESTSMSAIAAEVGVSSNTVTYHFGTKQDLWLVVYARSTEDFWGQYRRAFDGRHLLDVVREVLETTLSVRDEFPYHSHFRYRATGDALLHPDFMHVTALKSEVQGSFFHDLAEYGWNAGVLSKFESIDTAAMFLRFVIMGFFYTCYTLGQDGKDMVVSVLESISAALSD
jgi:AcrR family transcriptional regulator